MHIYAELSIIVLIQYHIKSMVLWPYIANYRRTTLRIPGVSLNENIHITQYDAYSIVI